VNIAAVTEVAGVGWGWSNLWAIFPADRPHFHSGIFFFRTDVSGVRNPIVFWPLTASRTKPIATSDTYGPPKRDERQAASAAAEIGRFIFCHDVRSLTALRRKKMSRNLGGWG